MDQPPFLLITSLITLKKWLKFKFWHCLSICIFHSHFFYFENMSFAILCCYTLIELLNDLHHFCNIWTLMLTDISFHIRPNPFNWIEIWWVRWGLNLLHENKGLNNKKQNHRGFQTKSRSEIYPVYTQVSQSFSAYLALMFRIVVLM